MKNLLALTACLACLLSPLAAAEGPMPRADGDQQCRTTAVTTPSKGEWVRVLPGAVLLASEAREECLWARLKSSARVSEAGAILKAGTLLWNAGETRYCIRDTATRFCLNDRSGDGRFDKSSTLGGSRGVTLSTAYEEVWIPTGEGEGDRRKELVLLEIAPDRLRGSLRENGTSNEVSYPVGETGQITLGDLRAEVRRVEGGLEVRVP